MITKSSFSLTDEQELGHINKPECCGTPNCCLFLFPFGRRGKFSGKFLIITESLVAIIYIGNH